VTGNTDEELQEMIAEEKRIEETLEKEREYEESDKM
jgi:hypothetical protein